MDSDYGLLGGQSEWDDLERVSVRLLNGRWMSDENLERELDDLGASSDVKMCDMW